jgi:hypothetical protein
MPLSLDAHRPCNSPVCRRQRRESLTRVSARSVRSTGRADRRLTWHSGYHRPRRAVTFTRPNEPAPDCGRRPHQPEETEPWVPSTVSSNASKPW